MKSMWPKSVFAPASALALAGCMGATDAPTSEEVATVQDAEINACPYPAPAVNFDKELIIRDTNVVNDACRTAWGASGCAAAGTEGKWTFGYLMTQMAGTNAPITFVEQWLNTWLTDQSINGFTVAKRTKILTNVINPWRALTGCPAISSPVPNPFPSCATLDLKRAPFRLLAIVNRLDLSGPPGVDPYGQVSVNPAPGEARFVFGFLKADALSNAGNGKLDATVNFEYRLPPILDTFQWAQIWHSLNVLDLGSSAYNNKLQQISELIVKTNAFPGKPNNGSSISQVRTDEIDFDASSTLSQRKWELREFGFRSCTTNNCFLQPDTVKQTPDKSLNMTASLDGFITSNLTDIRKEKHQVPSTFLAGSSLSGSGVVGSTNPAVIWDLNDQILYEDAGGPVQYLDRHLFALATCNGCHYAEAFTSRFHVAPRAILQQAGLSNFLGGGSGASANYQHSFADPVSGETRQYNEPWRRVCEMRRLLNNIAEPWSHGSGALVE